MTAYWRQPVSSGLGEQKPARGPVCCKANACSASLVGRVEDEGPRVGEGVPRNAKVC
jgi:hypothetical protein